MTHEDRTRRVAAMLSQVAGPNGIESLSVPRNFTGLESLPEGPPAEAASGLEKLRDHRSVTPNELFALEAIILPDKRPVVFIRNGVFDEVPMEMWRHLNDQQHHARLEPLFPSIGRVEVPLMPQVPFGGTAFVVGDDLLMTNRHVAEIFTRGLGRQLRYQTGGSAVDFKREHGTENEKPELVEVTNVILIHPHWDMALLQVKNLPTSAKKLPLSVMAPEEFVDREVVVVGYPFYDYRNPTDVQRRVFQEIYGVKRMQPGQVRGREKIMSFETRVDAMTHDSSTLGGNSGSAVIDIGSARVIGLHFGGQYLKANYAVPTYELARDGRVVEAGLNFDGSIAPWSGYNAAWVRAGDERTLVQRGGGRSTPAQPSPITPAPTLLAANARQDAARFMLPLHVTVSFGAPVLTTAPSPVAVTPNVIDESEVIVEKVPVIYPDLDGREGYREDFLEFDDGKGVPMPTLTQAGLKSVAKLDDGSPVLNYHRFSIVMHKKRRLALFTAANVDWRPESRRIDGRKPSRKELNGFTGNEREDWITDGRIPLDFQLPDYFYTKDEGAFDRGHLVRRDDVAWGDSFDEIQKGNGDTFHTTNCSPQVAAFNRSSEDDFNWGALENMVQQSTDAEKVCIFSGPVLHQDDHFFHGRLKGGIPVSVQIPQAYWKIIVANNDGKPAAFGFVLTQDLRDVDLYTELAVPNAWRKFMRPIKEIEDHLKGLAKLTWFKHYDQYK